MTRKPENETELVEKARADLASRLGLDKKSIKVHKVEAVDWPDASLGCPEPGYVYQLAITHGYRILLVAKGGIYDYRSDGRHIKLCSNN